MVVVEISVCMVRGAVRKKTRENDTIFKGMGLLELVYGGLLMNKRKRVYVSTIP